MKQERNRRLLLSVGQRLFAQKGYRDVSVGDVTKAVGLSTGSFYNYFSSKEALYSEILDRVEAQGLRRVERAVARLRSPVNKLRVVYRLVTLGVQQNPMLRAVLIGDDRYSFPGMAERRERGNDIRAKIRSLVMEVVRDGTTRNIFRSGSYKDPSRMISALFDAILLHLDTDYVDDLIEDLLLLLQRGLRRQIRFARRTERVDRRLMKRAYYDVEDDDADDEGQEP